MYIYLVFYTILIFSLGILHNRIMSNLKLKRTTKKIIDDINIQFSEVLLNLENKKTKFSNRVNNTVYITTHITDHGKIDILYLIDKDDIALFKNNACIYTSDNVNSKILSEILFKIKSMYSKDIGEVVNFMGFIFSKSYFEKEMGISVEDIQKQQTNQLKQLKKIQDENKSDIEKIIESNNKKINTEDVLNSILEKIGKNGMNNLSSEDKDFLKKYNEGKL